MDNINEKWSGYVLKLRRDNIEYTSGSWYKHYWSEVYDINSDEMQNSRGEKILIVARGEDSVRFVFFDELTPKHGVCGTVSLEDPKAVLRYDSREGGSNEFAWSKSDYVAVTLEKI